MKKKWHFVTPETLFCVLLRLLKCAYYCFLHVVICSFFIIEHSLLTDIFFLWSLSPMWWGFFFDEPFFFASSLGIPQVVAFTSVSTIGPTVQKQAGCQSPNQNPWGKPPSFLISLYSLRHQAKEHPTHHFSSFLAPQGQGRSPHTCPLLLLTFHLRFITTWVLNLEFSGAGHVVLTQPQGLALHHFFHPRCPATQGFTWIWLPVGTSSHLIWVGQND